MTARAGSPDATSDLSAHCRQQNLTTTYCASGANWIAHIFVQPCRPRPTLSTAQLRAIWKRSPSPAVRVLLWKSPLTSARMDQGDARDDSPPMVV